RPPGPAAAPRGSAAETVARPPRSHPADPYRGPLGARGGRAHGPHGECGQSAARPRSQASLRGIEPLTRRSAATPTLLLSAASPAAPARVHPFAEVEASR